MKHFLETNAITRVELDALLDLAKKIEANPKDYAAKLAGKIVATLFFEPSTRTRLSFESAAIKTGASVISTENGNISSSNMKGETLEDTIKVIAGYADAVVMRHQSDDSAHVAASVSTVPIINAGSGSAHHPSQALLDVFTIKKHRGKIDGLKVAFIGDLFHGRTANSLIGFLSLYKDITVYCVNPPDFGFRQDVFDLMDKSNVKYKVVDNITDIPSDCDVLYQTRVQRERIKGDMPITKFFINKQVMTHFGKNTIVLHPLPRVDEISVDFDDDARAIYFEQAHNGVPVRMAILLKYCGGL